MRTLVLGLGNPIATDDAVGIRLAHDLRARLGESPEVDWLPDCAAGGLDLLDHLKGYDRLIILDSIRTKGGRVGNWYHFTPAALRETLHLSSVHDANFATVLELGRRIGLPLPPDSEIRILAVEILENSCFGDAFSWELERAYPAIREEVLAEVRALLARGTGGARAGVADA